MSLGASSAGCVLGAQGVTGNTLSCGVSGGSCLTSHHSPVFPPPRLLQALCFVTLLCRLSSCTIQGISPWPGTWAMSAGGCLSSSCVPIAHRTFFQMTSDGTEFSLGLSHPGLQDPTRTDTILVFLSVSALTSGHSAISWLGR